MSFHAPSEGLAPEAVSDSILAQYYFGLWNTGFLDAARDWTRDYLTRKESVRSLHVVTDSFGPGFYGMGIDTIPTLARLANAERVGVSVNDDGSLVPGRSLVLIYLVLEKKLDFSIKDCSSCVGNRSSCDMCPDRR